MKRLVVDQIDYVPMRAITGVICRVVFYAGLGLGIGIVAALPWLYAQQSLLAEQNKAELMRCRQMSATVMSAVRSGCRGIGGN